MKVEGEIIVSIDGRAESVQRLRLEISIGTKWLKIYIYGADYTVPYQINPFHMSKLKALAKTYKESSKPEDWSKLWYFIRENYTSN